MYTHFSTPPTPLFALSISDKDHSTWGLSFKAPFNRLFLSPRSFFFLMDSKVETNLLFKKKLNSIKCLVPLWFDCRFKVQLTIKKKRGRRGKSDQMQLVLQARLDSRSSSHGVMRGTTNCVVRATRKEKKNETKINIK